MSKLFSCVAAVVLAGSSAALAGTPLNLLLLGDSITRQGRYVEALTNLLSQAGYSPTVLANEGHDAYLIQTTPYPWPDYRSGVANQVGEFLKQPGVNADNTCILVMVGTGDVDADYRLKETDDPNVQARMGDLITKITNTAPRAHLIVAQVVPNITSKEKDADVKRLNSDIAAAVAKAKTSGAKIHLVNMYDALSPEKYQPYTDTPSPLMADKLHPSEAAGPFMAKVWFDGIMAVNVPHTSRK
jgi:lysophospholipase L1-like esterase